MVNDNEEFNSKVNVGARGALHTSIPTSSGKIRINSDAAKREVEVCLVDGSLKSDCLAKITYVADKTSDNIPFVRVDNGTFIEQGGNIRKLNDSIQKALSGSVVEEANAEEIGRLVADIRDAKQRQVGNPLR